MVSTLKDWFGVGSTFAGLFARLEQLSRAGELDAALDLVFDQVDDLLLSERFPEVNRLLREVPVATLDSSILIGLLTVTGPAREALREARPAFVTRVREELEKQMPGGTEAAHVMRGLE